MEYGAAQQGQPTGAAGVPRLRPLDVGQKLDAAIKLTMGNFGTLMKLVLVLLVPINVLSFVITASTLPDEFTAGGEFIGGASYEGTADPSAGFVVGQVFVNLLGLLAFFLVPAICFKTIAAAYLGDRADWRESLSYVFQRFGRFLWLVFLIVLAVVAGFIVSIFVIAISAAIFPLLLLFSIPAVIAGWLYLGTSWWPALPALLLEDVRGFKALGRSHGLVRGRWWSTFGTLFLAWLLSLVITFLTAGLLALLTYAAVGDDTITAIALNFLANLVASALTTPFLAAVTIIVYFDLRVRKEAFDLELLARGIGGRPVSEALGQRMPWVEPPGWGAQPAYGGAPGWGQPPQPPGAPPAWGQPPQPPPAPGQPPQAPPGPPAWGPPHASQGPPGPPPAPAWGQPPQAPPAPTGWGEPQTPEPPEPPQRWEPPAPPEPPDRSSS